MEQNRLAHGAFAGGAGDDYAPLLPNHAPGPTPPDAPPDEPDEAEHAFASEAEEDAYWAGVVDGIHNGGGKVPPRLAARAAKEQLLVHRHGEPDEPEEPSPPPPADILDFTPVELRYRPDGWTPAKQREFVEALADTGVIRTAAERVGMNERSVSRLRRRADARTFDIACTGAQRIGARRLVSIAYERAIEGTIKRHFFHGELKAEERVYDNRLLIALLNKLPDHHPADDRSGEVEANWEPWMDALEQNLPPPPPPPVPPPVQTPAPPEPAEPALAEQSAEPSGEIWEDDDLLLTNFPPPPGFDVFQDQEPGEPHYQRALTPQETEYWEEYGEEEAHEDHFLGYVTWHLNRATLLPMEAGLSGPLATAAAAAAAAKPQGERSEASEACGESRPRPDGGASAHAEEPDRRHGEVYPEPGRRAGTPPSAPKAEDEATEARESSSESRLPATPNPPEEGP